MAHRGGWEEARQQPGASRGGGGGGGSASAALPAASKGASGGAPGARRAKSALALLTRPPAQLRADSASCQQGYSGYCLEDPWDAGSDCGAKGDAGGGGGGNGRCPGACGGGCCGGGWWGRLGRRAKALGALLRAHPTTWLLPLLFMLALAALGTAGVLLASRATSAAARAAAQGFAESAAAGVHTRMAGHTAALKAMEVAIALKPDPKNLSTWFPAAAARLLSHETCRGMVGLAAAPGGVVTAAYPAGELAVAYMHHDILGDPRSRDAALLAVQYGNASVQGPARRNGRDLVYFQWPVFLDPADAALGDAAGRVRRVPGAALPSGRRLWGFLTAAVDARTYGTPTGVNWDGRLTRLGDLDYRYAIVAPPSKPGGEPFVLGASKSGFPTDPVSAPIALPNGFKRDLWWQVLVAPASGWAPRWRDPMIAAVAVAAAGAGLLLFVTLVGRQRQAALIRRLQATNRELRDGKQAMDALLQRQASLIKCAFAERRAWKATTPPPPLGPRDGGGGGGGGGGAAEAMEERKAEDGEAGGGQGTDDNNTGSTAAPMTRSSTWETEALGQIEDMRRAIRVNSTCSAAELRLMEVLGEGGYGKVYRGVWRGIDVAVKVQVLPARMSGNEKRERMAIMEAAISTSMNHPNIVQTYTYTIKPITDSQANPGINFDGVGAFSVGRMKGVRGLQMQTMSDAPAAYDPTTHIHNFEVCLVLEFCDMGSLRDALDGGAFRTADGSVNYHAILETAADVARALLHLHKREIIHSDLKARNVLLKRERGAAPGRGAVAKVADFGLAVRMEAHDSHVSGLQGTLTHMAPEVQLEKQVTKASDVYSFGITLWELFTGQSPYKGVPMLLLAYEVVQLGRRPLWPEGTPKELARLAEACWQAEPERRPTFDQILSQLIQMRARLRGKTPELRPYVQRGHIPLCRETDGTSDPDGLLPTPSMDSAALHNPEDLRHNRHASPDQRQAAAPLPPPLPPPRWRQPEAAEDEEGDVEQGQVRQWGPEPRWQQRSGRWQLAPGERLATLPSETAAEGSSEVGPIQVIYHRHP